MRERSVVGGGRYGHGYAAHCVVRQWNLIGRCKDCVTDEKMVLVLCDGEVKRLS